MDQAFRLSTESLMGALDSACNRTCAGQSWINNYVSTLAEAPQYIQDLVQQAPETERFRFGNGAVLPSASRRAGLDLELGC